MDVDVSVVLPCLNEEKAIKICVDKIKDVFTKANIKGEIIVADNGSTDSSREIAEKAGAIVVREPRRGYGAAYLRGLKEVRGKYIIIADADNTYDFYAIPGFLNKLKEGHDFIMGSRFQGKIKKGAMPWMNRYVGNPILSGMTRLFFGTSLSDIHCGMRAFTVSAYKKMKLISLGMEFATEMVVGALRGNLKIAEIPIDYYSREGESKLKPFSDAWRHVRFMLLYCPLWLYFIPASFGLILGSLIMALLSRGPVLFLGRYWDVHMMVFGSALTILSYQLFNLGIFAHSYAIRQGFLKYDKLTLFFQRNFSLEKGLALGAVLFFAGFFLNFFIFIEWFSQNFGALYRIRESILAMTLLVIGLQTVFSSFFISLLFLNKK